MRSVRETIGGLGNLMFKEAYLMAQMFDGQIPDVYLQSEEYFKTYKEQIKQRFGQGIGLLPFVAIHVRRGDYVNNPFYVDLFKDGYYERAMAEFPQSKFIVFSDDIDWCVNQYIFRNCAFSYTKSEADALNEMASCVGHIIANSSFSWWGAYLSPHEGKVIAPARWFSDGVQRTTVPVSWKKI